ncbi:MAG: HEPN domain-containing protein [Anaerolineae bacterium]|nr:HEPN domain-containing protein [Anaerolineae bacterium]
MSRTFLPPVLVDKCIKVSYSLCVKQEAQWWVDAADYDLKTAKHMLDTRRYVYVIFCCHLSIERLLKACIIEFQDRFPPRSHNLEYLAQNAAIEFPEDLRTFVSSISKEAIKTRYDENRSRYTRAFAQQCFEYTKKVNRWLKRRLVSSR